MAMHMPGGGPVLAPFCFVGCDGGNTDDKGASPLPVSGIWMYLLGENRSADWKIGHTKDPTIRKRVKSVNGSQTADERYVLLAGVRASTKDEEAVKEYFQPHLRTTKGTRTEYFVCADECVEWISWMRRQWFVTIDPDARQNDWPHVDPSHWLPDPLRREPRPTPEPDRLVQPFTALQGPLAGTAWDWLPERRASVKDFFTPPEIVQAGAQAMGGIDVDLASHWLANFVHRIPLYYDVTKSAFDHEWIGNAWLNPPYGNNAPWFEKAQHHLATGSLEQLIILSPLWAFTTQVARPLMEMAAASLVFAPTPSFWCSLDADNAPDDWKGSNHPHAVVYFGSRRSEFLASFARFGLPFNFAWDEIQVSKEIAAV